MKKTIHFLSAVVMTAMMLSSCGGGASTQEATSTEVTIGNQVWMTQNLNVDKFRNGDPIPEARTNEEWKKAGENGQPAWCYYDNDPANGEEYGKLYNWFAVNDPRGLAPVGYHIPSNEEWTVLTDYLSGYFGGEDTWSEKMKSASGWINNGNGNGTNTSGFSGLPGGIRNGKGKYVFGGSVGEWWSSTKLPFPWRGHTIANTRVLDSYMGGESGDQSHGENGLSVRCLKD